jgi:hypothetical protein
LHTLAAALTDAVCWRRLGFLALHAVLMTPIGYVVIVGCHPAPSGAGFA